MSKLPSSSTETSTAEAGDHTVMPLLVVVQAVAPEAAPVKVDRFQPLKNTGGRQKRAAESESRVKRAHSGLVVLVSLVSVSER